MLKTSARITFSYPRVRAQLWSHAATISERLLANERLFLLLRLCRLPHDGIPKKLTETRINGPRSKLSFSVLDLWERRLKPILGNFIFLLFVDILHDLCHLLSVEERVSRLKYLLVLTHWRLKHLHALFFSIRIVHGLFNLIVALILIVNVQWITVLFHGLIVAALGEALEPRMF